MISRFLGAVVASAMVVAIAAPIYASQGGRVVPSDGKWAGIAHTDACNTVSSAAITARSTPDQLDCELLPVTPLPPRVPGVPSVGAIIEMVDFRIENRRVTSLAFDIVLNCHPSDSDHWSVHNMRFNSSPDWGYVVVGDGTGTAIPESGLLRIQFPVEETVQYPAGTVRATFDFRGELPDYAGAPRVALYYEGTLTEGSFTNRCVSNRNNPSVIPIRKRI